MDSVYLNNLLQKLKKFTQKVEIKEALVDKVWVIYGDDDLVEYEFERPSNVLNMSGEITVTKNGNSYDGSWKILGSGRLKIKTDFTNNTLEYDFSVLGILVMKIAGTQNNPFLLYDPKIVENGNLGKYLEKLEDEKESKKLPNSNGDEELTFLFSLFLVILALVVFMIKYSK